MRSLLFGEGVGVRRNDGQRFQLCSVLLKDMESELLKRIVVCGRFHAAGDFTTPGLVHTSPPCGKGNVVVHEGDRWGSISRCQLFREILCPHGEERESEERRG